MPIKHNQGNINISSESLKILTAEIVNDFLLIKWSDQKESFIKLEMLRDNCPCANCAGESDVFGNIYIGPPQLKTKYSYRIKQIETVGYYALRFHWLDRHSSGIYTYEFLRALNDPEPLD